MSAARVVAEAGPPPSLEVAKESLVVNTEFRLLAVCSQLRHDAVYDWARDVLRQLE
jgi:hypothetical protein